MKGAPAIAGALCAAALLAGLGGCDLAPHGGGNAAVREQSRGGLHYRLRSEVAPRRATLGDPVRWTLIAELPAVVRPGPLLLDSTGAELEVKQRGAPRRGDAPQGESWTWTQDVRGFDLGSLALPTARIAVLGKGLTDTLYFPPDTLGVDSLTQARADSLLPDRGPIPTELRTIDYAVGAGVLLLALALLWFAISAVRRARARKRVLAAAAAAPIPPEVTYRKALAALRESGQRLSFDLYFERLSGAIRDYAAAVTGVPARDRTTREIEREVAATGSVGKDGVEALVSALQRADLAKFARRAGGWDEARASLEEAERLPERLPAPAPAAEPAPGATAAPAAPLGPPSSGPPPANGGI